MNIELIRNDFKTLHEFLHQNNPNLLQFSNLLKDFTNNHFRNIIERMDIQDPDTDIEEAVIEPKKTKDQLLEEVLEKLNRNKVKLKIPNNDNNIFKTETVDECISAIKSLDSNIRKYEHKALIAYFYLGKSIIK